MVGRECCNLLLVASGHLHMKGGIMPKLTAADRQARYRARQRAKAGAAFAGVEEIELAFFGVNRDGHHVAIGMDGKFVELSPVPRAAVQTQVVNSHDVTLTSPKSDEIDTPEAMVSRPQKQLYMPKGWDPVKWQTWVDAIRERNVPADAVLANIDQNIGRRISQADTKKWERTRALIEAIPDVPEWRDFLPNAPVESPETGA